MLRILCLSASMALCAFCGSCPPFPPSPAAGVCCLWPSGVLFAGAVGVELWPPWAMPTPAALAASMLLCRESNSAASSRVMLRPADLAAFNNSC